MFFVKPTKFSIVVSNLLREKLYLEDRMLNGHYRITLLILIPNTKNLLKISNSTGVFESMKERQMMHDFNFDGNIYEVKP